MLSKEAPGTPHLGKLVGSVASSIVTRLFLAKLENSGFGEGDLPVHFTIIQNTGKAISTVHISVFTMHW